MLSTMGDTKDLPSKNVQAKREDESLLVSRNGCEANPSFRVYYADATVAVPFVWESRPGTPKHPFSGLPSLPPLTPPPSYKRNGDHNRSPNAQGGIFEYRWLERGKRSFPKPSNLIGFFPKLNLRKNHSSSSPPSILSTSPSFSSTSSTLSSATTSKGRRRLFSSWGSSSSFAGGGEEEDDDTNSPKSVLCFGMRNNLGLLKKPNGA